MNVRSRNLVALAGALAVVAPWTVALAADSTVPGEPAGGGGATIEVPADHETIQGAVDAAAPGDLILVSPGVYNEAVNVTDSRADDPWSRSQRGDPRR